MPVGVRLLCLFPSAIYRTTQWGHYCARIRNGQGRNPVVLYVPGSNAGGSEQNQSSTVFSVLQPQALCQGQVSTESFATSVIITESKPENKSVDY